MGEEGDERWGQELRLKTVKWRAGTTLASGPPLDPLHVYVPACDARMYALPEDTTAAWICAWVGAWVLRGRRR